MKKISLPIEVAQLRLQTVRRGDEARVAIGADCATSSCRERASKPHQLGKTSSVMGIRHCREFARSEMQKQ
jgi:hypothetical protein